ncbi:uncharacterized protein LOC121854998 [Homarus americanus]|uniref:uncharacterized protein LOC121854998 n=1 Tax=Homarus americanus TaxID=6706 RepID=UPI001C48809E|nr:uncharacterized protein LOC121854998 [Homarus americanus]
MMGPPRYIKTEWSGQGKAVLRFCSKRDKTDFSRDQQTKWAGKIECYVSSLYISEYERQPSTDAGGYDDDESQHCTEDIKAEVYECPPGVQPGVRSSWVEHWEAWKEVYIPLSWVHKYREHCTSEYIEWHDSYLEEYPWIIPHITDELGHSDIRLEDASRNSVSTNVKKEELDVLYDKHSQKRYWVHLRNYLCSYGVEDNGDLEEFFTRQAGIHYDEDRICNTINEQGMENQVDANIIINYMNEREIDNQVEDDQGIINNNDDESLENNEEMNVEYIHGQCWQEHDQEINVIKTEEQNQETDEPKKVQPSQESKTVSDDMSHDAIQKLDDEQLSELPEMCQLEDSNGEDVKEHCHSKLSRENSTELILLEHKENTTSNLINIKGIQDESRIVYVTKQLDGAAQDETKSDCDTSQCFVTRQFNDMELTTQVPAENQLTCDDVSHVSSVISDTDEEAKKHNSTLLTTSDTKKVAKTKKRKKAGNSRNSSGLSWALKYIQSQDVKVQHADAGHSLETASGPTCDSSDNAGGKTSALVSEHLDPPVNKTPCEPSICGTNKPLMDEYNVDKAEILVTQDVGDCAVTDNEKENEAALPTKVSQYVVKCAVTDREKESDMYLHIASTKDGGDNQKTLWSTILSILATGKFLLKESAFHFLSRFFPLFSEGIRQQLNEVTSAVSSCTPPPSKQQSLPPSRCVERVKEKRDFRCDKNHIKLYKWLQPLVSTDGLSFASTVNIADGVTLNEVRIQSDKRGVQSVYHSVEKTVTEGDRARLDVRLLDLDDDNSTQVDDTYLTNEEKREDWTRTHITYDEEGNPVSVAKFMRFSMAKENPERKERSVWKEIISGHQLVNYGKKKECPPPDVPEDVKKYWAQRHRLFIKYDEGIMLDQESWYSVTPEMIAAHQAYRCSCDVVVDAFCGAGGNAIQLAKTCNHVIAIDIDPAKIDLARHNAQVYGVADRIEFIIGDFFHLVPKLKADVVYLSPPWGGIKYLRAGIYDVKSLGGVLSCEELMTAARAITTNVALYLPRTSNLYQIIELAGPNGAVDIEYNHMGRKKKALTAYYGGLVHYC